MTPFEKIEFVRNKNRLGVLDFLERIGISKSSYYYHRDGKADCISAKNANKIVNTFPDIEYDWLVTDAKNITNNANIVQKDILNEPEDSYSKEKTVEDLIAEKVFKKLKPYIDKIELQDAMLTKILTKVEELEEKVTH